MERLHPRASLLGLPAELRIRIYDCVAHLDINCTVLTDIGHDRSDKTGTQETLIPDPNAHLARKIPWLNLRLTCKQLAAEVASAMTDTAFIDRDWSRTYVAEMFFSGEEDQQLTRQVIWRSLPCAAEDAQFLIVKVLLDGCMGPWTEGGAASFIRALYQVLNHLCHNGPRLVASERLPDHVHLQRVTINVDIGVYWPEPATGCSPNPQHNWSLSCSAWKQIAECGLLHGYVDKLIYSNNFGDEREYSVEHKEAPAVPMHWQGYGFDWGAPGLQFSLVTKHSPLLSTVNEGFRQLQQRLRDGLRM